MSEYGLPRTCSWSSFLFGFGISVGSCNNSSDVPEVYGFPVLLYSHFHLTRLLDGDPIMCIDDPESTTNSLSSGLIVDGAGRHQVSGRTLFYFSHLIKGYIWPASTLLHGHIALAIPSLLENDPQNLGHWGCADEDHLSKLLQAMVFGLEC